MQSRSWFFPPRILQNGKASCAFAALDTASPSWSHQGFFWVRGREVKGENGKVGPPGGGMWRCQSGLATLATKVPVIVLDDHPDNCPAMFRCKHKVAKEVPDNCLYDEHGGCGAHVLHNIIFKSTGEQEIVGNCHAVQFVLAISGRRNELLKCLKQVLEEELVVHPGPPPARYAQYTRNVVESTLLRREKHVRARLGDADPGSKGATLREVSGPLCQVCNGDITKDVCGREI